jgi:two-component system, OmpR family, sensor histidine kinase VicK
MWDTRVTTNGFWKDRGHAWRRKVTNVIPQFLSKAERVDSCADHKAASLAIGGESYKKLLLDLNRGLKTRYITEVIRRNIYYCKEMMKFAEEVHHIDRLKANFSVSEAKYIATTAAQQVAGQPVSGYL